MHARRFERIEVLDIEPPVARAGGEDHGAGLHPFADLQTEGEGAGGVRPRARLVDLVGDRHLGAEFLRLIVGARHQRHAGDSGRKAEIVFDPRRCAGLAAECAAIEDQDGQSFRRRIDGRGEAGRPGADDGDVVDTIRIDRPHQTEAARQFVLAGIAQ